LWREQEHLKMDMDEAFFTTKVLMGLGRWGELALL
jgi:hypothetical protein